MKSLDDGQLKYYIYPEYQKMKWNEKKKKIKRKKKIVKKANNNKRQELRMKFGKVVKAMEVNPRIKEIQKEN